MKPSRPWPTAKPNVATGRLYDSRASFLDVDDDILLPADYRPVSRQPAPVLNPPPAVSPAAAKTTRSQSSQASQAGVASRPPRIQTSSSNGKAVETDPQRLTALLAAAGDRIAAFEKTIAEQAERLALYQNQIRDLSSKGDQQAGDLQSACRVVGVLEQSVTTLREAVSERDAELAAANEKLDLADQMRLALQAQIEAAQKDHMQASNKLLAAETALNDQNAATAAAWETIDRSNAEIEQLRIQNTAIETELNNVKQQHGRELGEQREVFEREIEIVKAHSQQSARQAETMAMDRAVLHRRCEDLIRTVGLLQASRRQTSSNLQANVGDLRQIHAELSEMKASHASMAGKFEQAEVKLGRMRQHIEELEKSSATVAQQDAALVSAAAKNESFILQESQHAEQRRTALDELGAEIIKLETATRGKKVA